MFCPFYHNCVELFEQSFRGYLGDNISENSFVAWFIGRVAVVLNRNFKVRRLLEGRVAYKQMLRGGLYLLGIAETVEHTPYFPAVDSLRRVSLEHLI